MQHYKLGHFVNIRTGKLNANAQVKNGIYPFFTCAKDISQIDKYAFDCECVLIAGNGELNVKYYNGKFNAYQRVYIVESTDKEFLDSKYLYYFLSQQIHIIKNKAIGGVIKYIKLEHLADIKIPIPNIEKQKQIVTVLDKMQLLIQKRDDSILKLRDLQRSIFIEMFGDPILNPYNWATIKLKNIIKIDAGWSPICHDTPRVNDTQIGILKQSAITKGYFDSNENKLLPNNTLIKKAVNAQKDGLLFSRKNTKKLVGSTVFLYKDYENLLIPDTIFRINYNKSKVSGVYLSSLFNDSNFNRKLKELSTGAVESMVNISQEKLLNLEVIYPDYDKQKRYEIIIRKIQQEINTFIIQSKEYLSNLFFSFSQRAFRGETFYNIDTELESLLNLIDVEKKDSENDITILSKDRVLINRLLDRIKSQDFKDIWLYDKAKYALFRIMNDNKEIFQHEFDIESESTNTRVI